MAAPPHLVADLPAGADVAGTAVAERAQPEPSWHASPIGGLRVFGPWRMDRHVIVISLIGGTRLDLSQAELAAPEVTLTNASLAGVRAENLVRGSDQRACSPGPSGRDDHPSCACGSCFS